MELRKIIQDAIILQDNLNKTIDPNWKQNRNLIDWVIAINQEFAELMDSLNWAWWKKNNPNINNVKVELVDILHFLLSYMIQYAEKINMSFEDLVTRIDWAFQTDPVEKTPQAIMKLYRNFLFFTEASEFSPDSIYISIIWKPYCKMVRAFMSEEELFKMYFFKNALNKLRKDFGYKEGKYQKIWNGKEDNEVMTELMKNLEEVNFETAYNLLKEEYLKYGGRR